MATASADRCFVVLLPLLTLYSWRWRMNDDKIAIIRLLSGTSQQWIQQLSLQRPVRWIETSILSWQHRGFTAILLHAHCSTVRYWRTGFDKARLSTPITCGVTSSSALRSLIYGWERLQVTSLYSVVSHSSVDSMYRLHRKACAACAWKLPSSEPASTTRRLATTINSKTFLLSSFIIGSNVSTMTPAMIYSFLCLFSFPLSVFFAFNISKLY